MEYYETSKIRGYRYRIETDDFVTLRVSIEDVQANTIQWTGFNITQRLKIVIDRWTNKDEQGDREYIVDDDEDTKKVQKAINDGRALLSELRLVQSDEEQAKLIGKDLADLEYDMMIFVGKLFEEFGTGTLPEAVEEALNL